MRTIWGSNNPKTLYDARYVYRPILGTKFRALKSTHTKDEMVIRRMQCLSRNIGITLRKGKMLFIDPVQAWLKNKA